MKINHNCDKCSSLVKGTSTVCMSGFGNPSADMMILMEFPDALADDSGKPDAGRSVKFLEKQILKPNNIDMSEVYVDYAVRCRPKNGKKPSRNNVVSCRPYLESVIKKVNPKVILVLGNSALCSMLFLDQVGGISKWRGKRLWSQEFSCWIVPTYQPGILQMDRRDSLWFRFDQVIADLKLAYQSITKPAPKFKMPKYRVLSDPDEIVNYMSVARKSGLVAVDTETDGFNPKNEILGASFTFKKNGKYYPIYINWRDIDDVPASKEAVAELLADEKTTKIFQNVSFDRKFFHYHGYELGGRIDDTMIMASLLDENFSVGLKERTWVHLPFGGYDRPLEQYKFDHKFTKKSSYKDIPFDVMAPYAAYDTLATYMLYETFVPMLKEQELFPVYDKVVMPVRMVMTDAEINGIYVNMKRAMEIKDLCNKALKNLEKEIYVLAKRSFNFNSTMQLAELLFDELHAPNSGRNKKSGNWKCDKSALTKVAEGNDKKRATHIARAVLKYKYITKLNTTYIGQAERNVWDDGRVHSQYNTTGTVTGRVSNSNPCTHNIPRDKMIRSLYSASPGNLLVEADIKAAEMRTIALESKDELLLEIIRSGSDIHNRTYNAMFNKPDDYVPTSSERRIAKSINFGLVYGITAVGLSRRIGTTVDEAQSFIDLYFKQFTGVARWIRDTVKFAHDQEYVVSLFKRRRRLTDINNDDMFLRWRAERQAMNSPIQSAAADFTYIVLVRVANAMKKHRLRAKIVHTVHDCVIVDTPPDEVETVKAIIYKAFNSPVKAFPMKMDVDIEVGYAWGESGDDSELEKMLLDLAT